MENEIKLLARHEDLDALLHSPLLQKFGTAPPIEHLLFDTYFDTPERELRSRHASLRLRKAGDIRVQTLKTANGADGGLHRREEYELPITRDWPALSSLRKLVGRKSALNDLLHSRKLKRRLGPVFSTRITRTVFPLKLARGDTVECAVDVGEIVGNGATVPVCEVELELKSGDVAHLVDFALELTQEVPMAMGELSKGERGYALLASSDFVASKAAPVLLKKKMTVEQAFSDIVANCLMQIEANAAGVARCDSEGLHQMRVGLRRLRSALGMMDGLIALPETLAGELDWLAGQLGEARDWDVLAHATLGELKQAWPAEASITEVTDAVMSESEQTQRLAAAAVATPRYARLILMLSQWRLDARWRNGAVASDLALLDAPVTDFARKALGAAHKRLLKRGNALDGAAPDAAHRVRLAAKKMRYISEFFQSLFGAHAMRSFVKQLSGLQDEFGRLNDVAVADRLLSTLQQKRPELGISTGYVRGVLVANAANVRHSAKKSWRKFSPARLPH